MDRADCYLALFFIVQLPRSSTLHAATAGRSKWSKLHGDGALAAPVMGGSMATASCIKLPSHHSLNCYNTRFSSLEISVFST